MRTLRPRLAVASMACVFSAIFAATAPAHAQTGPARTAALAGTVRDTLGHPIRMVAVLVEGTELSAVTDDSGRFHIKGIPAGVSDFTLRRIGYSSVQFGTTLAPDSTLVLDIRMKSVTALNPVTVEADASVPLHRAGFYERQRLGLGTFISPARVDSLSNLSQASMILMAASVRGLRRVCPAGRNLCDIQMRSLTCRWLFVDGVQVDGVFDELVSPAEVAAVEVYDRISIVPSEFQGRLPMKTGGRMTLTPMAGCGAIAVWTRIRARRP